MCALRLPAKGRFLLLDGSSQTVQTGYVENGQWVSFHAVDGDALESLFPVLEKILSVPGRALGNLDGFIYGCGPGSLLGLRITAMAVRGWRSLPRLAHIPCFGFESLSYAGQWLLGQGEEPAFHVVSAFRRDLYNHLRMGEDGGAGKRDLISADDLKRLTENIFLIRQRALNATSDPENARAIPYKLDEFPAIAARTPLLEPLAEPSVIMPADPSFARWHPERHRGNEAVDPSIQR